MRIEFPKIPTTCSDALARRLCFLGAELVGLHLLESPLLRSTPALYIGPIRPKIEKVLYADEVVWLDKARTYGFRGVPLHSWEFRIGGYQVCDKWLKDRKGGELSKADIEHYQKIVVALSETIRLMTEIDKVIESHGGWPGAFVAGKQTATKSG